MTKKKKYVLVGRAVFLLIGYAFSAYRYGSVQHALLTLVQTILAHPTSILLFCCLYLIRPFTFIPVGWLSTIAGVFWGWWPGIAIALGGEMLSACIAFQNGRFLGPKGLDHKKEEAFGKFSFMLLRHPLLAVILSRMSPLPDDVINYGRGMLRISRFTYFWGSLLGNVFFSVLNILMGVQIDPEKLLAEGFATGVNWPIFILTFGIYLITLLISWVVFRSMSSSHKKKSKK